MQRRVLHTRFVKYVARNTIAIFYLRLLLIVIPVFPGLSALTGTVGQKKAALESGRRATEILPTSRDDIIGGFYLAQLAMVEAQVGEKQSALNHIAQLLAIPVGHVVSSASLRLEPVWDPLRSDPRFQKLYEEKRQ